MISLIDKTDKQVYFDAMVIINLKLIYKQVYLKFMIIDAYNKVDR